MPLGHPNTANDLFAMEHNTTGSSNIAVGISAGSNLTTGNYNIDIGNSGNSRRRPDDPYWHMTQTAAFIAGIKRWQRRHSGRCERPTVNSESHPPQHVSRKRSVDG